MSWIKGSWKAFVGAILAFFAFMAVAKASREKESADKWKKRANDEAESLVEDSVSKANQSLTQAKLHEEKAKVAKAKAEQKLAGINDESIRDLVSGWTDDNRMRDNSGT